MSKVPLQTLPNLSKDNVPTILTLAKEHMVLHIAMMAGLINIKADCRLYSSPIFWSKKGCIVILVTTVTSSSFPCTVD